MLKPPPADEEEEENIRDVFHDKNCELNDPGLLEVDSIENDEDTIAPVLLTEDAGVADNRGEEGAEFDEDEEEEWRVTGTVFKISNNSVNSITVSIRDSWIIIRLLPSPPL